ncbi:hypothetical protein KP001_20235 [Geomonas subterranea]|uniref:Uncharacterized protein n=1 Tax=Geomonas subterranea TaxID=2847989 RepID=A0ABX8LIF4_9BACT|nr:hypothetical protein [Geomonas subterranea]QXE90691.1 hypothetical protein KP001_20235 [Geomonas subterranea]QXM11227.1 hypothetical protein KP002_09045 [Geomonas subterranea]
MDKLFKKVLLLALPYVLYLSIPVWLLVGTKELGGNINQIIDNASKGNPQLVGFGFNESCYRYMKLKILAALPRRDVVALGSSRVLQFRDKMFAPNRFYNAGYTIKSIPEFMTFVSLLPEDKLPRTLIIGLDHWMFNARYDHLNAAPNKQEWLKYDDMDVTSVFKASKKVYKRTFSGVVSLDDVLFPDKAMARSQKDAALASVPKFGFNACVNKTGFRNDGSMYYGIQIEKLMANASDANDFKFKDTLHKVAKGQDRFKQGGEINEEAVRQLRLFLAYCQKKNIHVVAFLPPFTDTVWNKMVASGKFHYLDGLNARLQHELDGYGYEFYDFSTFSSAGATDLEAIDGFHGGESVYLGMLIRMLDRGSKLNEFCNVNKLREDAARKFNRYTVYQSF